jgi:uncharacterized protein YoxC
MQVPLIKTKTSFTLFLERLSIQSTRWIGSTQSLATHTVLFISCFILILLGFNADKIMLVLTTIVSLEAIYLSIFIQMSVNRQARRLREVSRDIEEISEDVEGIQKDVEEIQEDVEEISEDEEEEEENDPQFDQIKKTLETLLEEVAQLKGTKAKKLITPKIANKK